MRYFLSFIFLFILSINIYSQEKNILPFDYNEQYSYYDKIETDSFLSWMFIFPPPNENSF